MNIAICKATAEIFEIPGDFKHPSLTYARFIFADDKPNGNMQGIKYEDFPLLMQSAVDMPIKLRFLANAAGGHKGSVPIGHIRSLTEKAMEDGSHQLIAEAVLYAEEYPQEVNFLKQAYASGDAPGISWEVGYQSEDKKDGVSWLRGAIAKAATFVNNPAYGARTALLALASSDISADQMSHELTALASEFSLVEGGNSMDEKREKELLAEIEGLKTQLAEATASKTKVENELTTAKAEVTSKEEVIAQYAKKSLIEDRTKKVADAGLKIETDAEKLKAKQEFWSSLSEEAFTEYVADLAFVSKPVKTAQASLNKNDVPKLSPAPTDAMDFQSLKNRMGRRGLVASATE